MLLAVEGGGFFSSSASGYSKGLTLLFLGQKNEEKPMRVTPWNQYQLVDQDTDSDLQLASGKNRFVRGCASFVCFGRAAAGLESPSPLKVGPAQQQEVLPQPPVTEKCRDQIQYANDHNSDPKVALKSSLKKPSTSVPVAEDGSDESVALCGKDTDAVVHTESRKVQWTDTSGGELVEIREFELSDDGGSDDEFDNGSERNCSCMIM
ncbi:unnamed protein product [Coffea canephora]|uniref:Uncharacterized protein n=2 Tax=Coffea TaxID=13442 RepID=A0A068USB7_COFCA|nr:uncharacterized protein LOC113712905 [Coffea arabica]XP_027095084.1 uncharacterized protein LOC113715113 [Coffea arabica]XP_027095085.1 uncharacterized protein LOC113715113 [Coffea arabica]XP_027148939.1 uncharacterized protein LOC113749408 [Coffea eugenioides]CDP11435.1 unnamed protein product [Coffea canephora]